MSEIGQHQRKTIEVTWPKDRFYVEPLEEEEDDNGDGEDDDSDDEMDWITAQETVQVDIVVVHPTRGEIRVRTVDNDGFATITFPPRFRGSRDVFIRSLDGTVQVDGEVTVK